MSYARCKGFICSGVEASKIIYIRAVGKGVLLLYDGIFCKMHMFRVTRQSRIVGSAQTQPQNNWKSGRISAERWPPCYSKRHARDVSNTVIKYHIVKI